MRFSVKLLNVTLVLGSSGVGELIANTLAVRHVTVVVLDIKPIVTENCKLPSYTQGRPYLPI